MMFHVTFPLLHNTFRCYVNQNGGHSNTEFFAQFRKRNDGYSQQFQHRLSTRSDEGRKVKYVESVLRSWIRHLSKFSLIFSRKGRERQGTGTYQIWTRHWNHRRCLFSRQSVINLVFLLDSEQQTKGVGAQLPWSSWARSNSLLQLWPLDQPDGFTPILGVWTKKTGNGKTRNQPLGFKRFGPGNAPKKPGASGHFAQPLVSKAPRFGPSLFAAILCWLTEKNRRETNPA